MAKPKAGKKAKKAARASAPRKTNQGKPAAPATQQAAPKKELAYPHLVHVKKGAEVLPVTVKDAAHRARLVEEFGEANLEVVK